MSEHIMSIALRTIFLSAVITGTSLHAQMDKMHYIPAMFGYEDLGTHTLVLSTNHSNPFNVTVTNGNGDVLEIVTLSAANSATVLIGNDISSPFMIHEPDLNTPQILEGLILEGDYPLVVDVISEYFTWIDGKSI